MYLYGINAFSRLIGEPRKTVETLLRTGALKHVKKYSDRVEIGADDALDYLAKKYPKLMAGKSEYATQQARCANDQIVKEVGVKGIVKDGREGGSYIYDN